MASHNPSSMSLEQELAALLTVADAGGAPATPDAPPIGLGRAGQMALRYWGWDGRGGTTLEETGREFGGITRERVRQIIAGIEQALASLEDAGHVRVPRLDAAMKVAADAAPTTANDLARRLTEVGLSRAPFHPEGLASAAVVLMRAAPFALEKVRGIEMALPCADSAGPPGARLPNGARRCPTHRDATIADPGARDLVVAIVDAGRDLVRHAGAARIDDIVARVAAGPAALTRPPLPLHFLDPVRVTAVLSDPDDFVWLDRATGWFTYPSLVKNAVTARVRKMLGVSPTLPVSEVLAGLRRDQRLRDFSMSERVLAEFCDYLSGIAVDGDFVRALEPIDPEVELEGAELIMVRMLREHGPELPRAELERLCLAAGVSVPSFRNRIAYSPVIAARGDGAYALRGHDCGAQTKATSRPSIRR